MVNTDTPPPQPGAAMKSKSLSTADYMAAEDRLSIEEKAALATHLAAGLGGKAGEDFAEAEAVLRLMTWNAEPRVVEAMAKAAAANPNTPRSLAWALANDDEAAATAVLEACGALSDEDLVSLVQAGGNAVKMRAIARRSEVSEEVSRSLVDHGDEDTVHTLLANTKAHISDAAYGTALDRFGKSERIQEGIVSRPVVSAQVSRRLADSLSPQVRDKLARKHPGKLADKPAAPPPPATIPGYADERSDSEWDVELSSMVADRSLTETALVRQLFQGNFEFFARALALLAKEPVANVRAALLATPPGLGPLWQSAGLPVGWLAVASAAVAALIQVDRSAGKADPDLFTRNIVSRTQANLKAAKIVLTDAQKRFFARPGGFR